MTNTLVNAQNLTKNAESDYSTEGNLPVVESQLMSIDMANAAFIMESLTNLYSDPYLSVVREYVANAIDSHIEAGNSAPVEVTAPSSWSPNLIIKDQGIGMSQEDVFRYGTYGSSDKRDNLDVVGNFGMGSKSALAITNSFTITAAKDGEYTMASIGRNDEGYGQVDIIANEPTTEPNGVTITIPVTSGNIWTVQNKIPRVIESLPAGRVSVDGKINTDFRDDLVKISDDAYVSDFSFTDRSFHYNGITIISGGFGYTVDHGLVNEISDKVDFDLVGVPSRIYIDVPTGSVDLTPSREQLRMTARTKALIVESTLSVLRECTRISQEKLKSISTFEEAYKFTSGMGSYDHKTVFGLIENIAVSGDGGPVTKMIRTGSGEHTDRNTRGIDEYLLALIAQSPNNKVIIMENDKNYSSTSVTGRIKKYLTKVTDKYSSNTPVIMLNPDYVDDPTVTKDTLYRFVSRTADRMKLSEIYSAVNVYNKENRTYSGGGVATGRDDSAVIDTTSLDGETFEVKSHQRTSGQMREFFKGYFDNTLNTEFILNETKASGNDIDAMLLSAVLAILHMDSTTGSPVNMVLIKGSSRKTGYFIQRGIPVLTVKEFFEKNKDSISSDAAIDALKTIGCTARNNELGYRLKSDLDRFRLYHQEARESIDSIITELSHELTEDVKILAEALPSHRWSETVLVNFRRILGMPAFDGPIADIRYGEAPPNRGELVRSVLSGCVSLIDYGHTQEAYDMLETLVGLLTNKKED